MVKPAGCQPRRDVPKEILLFRRVSDRSFACLIRSALCGVAEPRRPTPRRPIRLVLGVGTGGVGDVTMRLVPSR